MQKIAEIIVTLHFDNKKFMLRKVAIFIISGIAMVGMMSCNHASNTITIPEASSEVLVTSFSLKANDSILSSLDSVYFSIDLNNARIFNADSLPKGTNISRLGVNISVGYVSKTQLLYKTIYNNDTVIEYDEENTQYVNFADGPVTLRLTAVNGIDKRDYSIQVNVHTLVSDSLMWMPGARRDLPTSLETPTAQKTVKTTSKFVCMTSKDGKFAVATAETPSGEWSMQDVELSFNPDLDELTALDEKLYILSDAGDLYESSDYGVTWTDCSIVWHHILGAYEDTLLGVSTDGTIYNNVTYPETTTIPIANRFPVKGNSQFVIYTSEWTTQAQAIMIGGRDASGKKLYDTWAYDGKSWANLTKTHPEAADGMILLPYFTCKTSSTNWKVTKESVLLCMGGQMSNGKNNETVYVSRDLGFNWHQADSLMQLPDFIAPVNMAQAFVEDVEYTLASAKSRSTNEWTPYPTRMTPRWWVNPLTTINSRAVAAITSWDVPTIYMFGGYDNDGNLVNSVWSSAITTLMFKPIQ